MIKDISASYPYPVKYISIPGDCTIAYMDEGAGPQTLVFVHGLANYAPVWAKNIVYLKQHFRCIAIDLPGNGLSDRNPHHFTMSFFADALFHFINAANLHNVVLVGHSMGGQVCMTTILKYPGFTGKLVLMAPAGFEAFSALEKTMYYATLHLFDYVSTEEHSLRNVIESSFYHMPKQAFVMIDELSALMKQGSITYYRRMVEQCMKSMLEEPVHQKLGAIHAQTMIFFGQKDALIPNKVLHHYSVETMVHKATKLMPNAHYKLLKDCGHFVHWEKADEVNPLLEKFLLSEKNGI
jgi:pimeloyl-ACP methyl ester carboxylesterase